MNSDQYFALNCMTNALRFRRELGSAERGLVGTLISGGAEALGVQIPDEWKDDESAPPLRSLKLKLIKVLNEHLVASAPEDDWLSPGLAALQELFRLSVTDRKVLELLLRRRGAGLFTDLYEVAGIGIYLKRDQQVVRRVAAFLGVREFELRAAISADSGLMTSGLCYLDDDGDLNLGDRIHRVLQVDRPPPERLADTLLGPGQTTDLGWEDFGHIQEARDHLLRLLQGALEHRAAGINILIYGPPGTGKTELCKVMAARAKCSLHSAGTSDESGGEPRRDERIAALKTMQKLLQCTGKGLLLMDEAQDLFASDGGYYHKHWRPEGSRVYMHQMLESAPVPILWTANDITDLGQTVLRRMTYVLELKRPPTKVRALIWGRLLKRAELKHTESDCVDLARTYNVAPALAATAARSARLSGGGIADVRATVSSLDRAVEGGRINRQTGEVGEFLPGIVRTDLELEPLLRRLSAEEARRTFSFCLFGPPGSGKSAFGRELASRMGLEMIQKRYSDLASKWLGETEQKIAAAFEEARDANAVLIFDEADSLLSDRQQSQHSWEVSQVNEMLTWMESHPLPFVCSTNLMSRLDPAALRRFTFKIRFDYLSPDQVRLAYSYFFGVDAAGSLDGLVRLTPGDFKVVRAKAEILGCIRDLAIIVQMLRDEQTLKPDYSRPIGFAAA